MNLKICLESEENDLLNMASQHLVQNVKISKEKFISLKYWFEDDENSSALGSIF